MSIYLIILIVVIALLLFVVAPVVFLSYKIYMGLMVRETPDKWVRGNNYPEDEEYCIMFDTGVKWREDNKAYKKEVDIVSEGFKLYGEYYDFGNKDTAFIVAGRPESLLYSGFFAKPYVDAGYNILIVDNRATGISEGKYTAAGQQEYKDVIAWCKYIHEELNTGNVYLHGVCIGSATCLYAITDKTCPSYVVGMTAEGMYYNFNESIREHMVYINKPLFPFQRLICMWIKLRSKADVIKEGPFTRIEVMKKPILFLHSKADCFSLPEKLELIAGKCKAPHKVVWFEDSFHSRIRVNHETAYDNAINIFIDEYIKN